VELERYLVDLSRHVLALGLRELSELSPEVLQGFVRQRGEGLSASTVKGVVWSVRKLCAFLTIRGYLAVDPAADLHHPKISARANLPEFLDEHELRKLLSHAAEKGEFQDFVLVSLFASTGMRVHEVASLRFGNVDWDRHCVHHPVKGDWRKQTPLNQSMAELFIRWKAHRGEPSDEAPVFLNSRGRRAQVPWIQTRVKQLGRAARLERPLTSKMLRHCASASCATWTGVM